MLKIQSHHRSRWGSSWGPRLARCAATVSLVLAGPGACTRKDQATEAKPSDPATAQMSKPGVVIDLSGLPRDVLVGTDLESIADHLKEAKTARPGRYNAETGGSASTAVLSDGPSSTFTRIFKEPGLEPLKRVYPSLKGLGPMISGDDIRILGFPEGILVLEMNSGTDAIPAAYWTRYSWVAPPEP